MPWRKGAALADGMRKGRGAEFAIMEGGWWNIPVGAGFYRSLAKEGSYPNLYINTIRKYADPEPKTLWFQVEGADRFKDTTSQNLGGKYANRALDVGALRDSSGFYVGWTEPGEWLEFQNVYLGCGTYRFTARVAASRSGGKVQFSAGDRSLREVELTSTRSCT